MLGLASARRLKALEEQVASLKRAVEERDFDWVEMRSRCKRLLDRTEKAAKRVDESVESEGPQPQNGGGTLPHVGHALTPRQMEIQQQVLKRRAGGT